MLTNKTITTIERNNIMKNLHRLMANAMVILDELGITYGTIKSYSTFTNRRCWGVCKKVKGENNTYIIEINEELLDENVSYAATMNTIVHELLHAERNRMCHTGEWKRCANLVNEKYPEFNIKRCTSAYDKGVTHHTYVKRNSSIKYMVICEDCGNIYYYRRKGSVINLLQKYGDSSGCRCGVCKSNKLGVITL